MTFPGSYFIPSFIPNTEIILIADVDIDLLREQHHYGAVQNLMDRRKDLFELKRK